MWPRRTRGPFVVLALGQKETSGHPGRLLARCLDPVDGRAVMVVINQQTTMMALTSHLATSSQPNRSEEGYQPACDGGKVSTGRARHTPMKVLRMRMLA